MSEFVTYLQEMLQDLGSLHARRMFGGYGLYHDGLMFALIADDTLYLKADDESRPHFEALGLPCFEYRRQERIVKMSYYQAPADMLEEREQATLWAKRAYAAALRARPHQD
ncbi:TfoX/Sxy family protein [Methylobacillus gramineus]|uniref:TfoX/Sxy family protein n=1 Tax=Methylobacillus gramineus TaxID=755169 RepID=UPI001CFFC3D7|nr:TfoX/Sxy family protein [Methylobacillus gramineus]MCB5184718.1 TfoX/Sxy family protein [Methylobacillus gramineus]